MYSVISRDFSLIFEKSDGTCRVYVNSKFRLGSHASTDAYIKLRTNADSPIRSATRRRSNP